MGTYYSYNTNYLITSIDNREGNTGYTYSNDRISSITTPKSNINYARDTRGNITEENIDGYIITRTYDSKNRITSEYDIYNHYTYSYSDEISDGIYSYIIVKNIIINNESIWLQTIKKDNIGNIIYNNFYNKEIKSYNYDGINVINFYHNQQGISYSYNGYNQLSQVYDNRNTKYNYTYSNDNIATVNYNINKSLISKTFNGTLTFEYLTNPKQDKIYYNNVLKYTLNYNNYDQLISDDYNNFTYDVNNSIRQNEINNVIFNYYKNSIGYTPNSSVIYNYFYSDTILGYTKLKTDSYYSNITFHNNPNVSIINSCITSILKYQDKLYPLQNNLLDVNNNGPSSFSKQEYKLFYYDKDIDSYATLLYGTRIIYETNVYNQGIIELEFKLENRNLDQLILELHNNRTIRLFRDNNNKLKIHSDYTNITYNTNYYVYSNVWYKLKVKITEFSFYVDIKRITDINYNEYSVSNTLNENMTVKIQLGQIDYIYNHMTTFGLVRNLFVSNNITNREYVNISKTDCHLYNNQLLSSKIEQNNAKIIINREIISIDEDINNHNCIESKKLSLSSNNVLKALMQTYDDKNMCYKKKIIINILSQISSIYTYNYDTFNRLTREDIYDTHDSLLYYNTYTYDYLNNITSYNEYDNQSAVTKSISFNYNQT